MYLFSSLSDLSDLNLGTCDSNLGLLDLSGNRVRTLDSDILARMVHLKALNFSRNGINQVHDGALKGLKSLWSLDLSHNEIVALPASLFQVKISYLRLRIIDSFPRIVK